MGNNTAPVPLGHQAQRTYLKLHPNPQTGNLEHRKSHDNSTDHLGGRKGNLRNLAFGFHVRNIISVLVNKADHRTG